MGLSALQQKILSPFVDETIKTLKNKLGLQATAKEGFEENVADFSFQGYALVSNTTGVIEGRILMHHYPETAIPIANKVLGKDAAAAPGEQLTDELVNALADFSQQAIAPAIAELEKSDIEINFSPAYFLSGADQSAGLKEGVKHLLTIPIHVENFGRFYFNYLINNELGQ